MVHGWTKNGCIVRKKGIQIGVKLIITVVACSRRSGGGKRCEVKEVIPLPLPRFYFFALLFSSYLSPLSERLEQAITVGTVGWDHYWVRRREENGKRNLWGGGTQSKGIRENECKVDYRHIGQVGGFQLKVSDSMKTTGQKPCVCYAWNTRKLNYIGKFIWSLCTISCILATNYFNINVNRI